MRDRFYYDSVDPVRPLVYKVQPSNNPRVQPGDKAGYLVNPEHTRGVAARITVGGKKEAVHRVVWRYFNGDIPEGYQIDHIDGNVYNNLIDNLQCIPAASNKHLGTSSLYKNNKSGMTGVLWDSKSEKWKVSFKSGGTLYYFGVFKDLERAKDVCRAKRAHLTNSRRG